MRTLFPIMAAAVALTLSTAGCERESVNPPTEPAQPVTGSGASVGSAPAAAASGPASFVGQWAANLAWCARPPGPQGAFVITPTRFDGAGNRCEVVSVVEVDDAYVAELSCQRPDQAVREHVRLAVTDDILNLSWLDRDGADAQLYRCPGSPEPQGQTGLGDLMKSE